MTPTLALSGSLWLSGSLLLSYFAYIALDRHDALSPALSLLEVVSHISIFLTFIEACKNYQSCLGIPEILGRQLKLPHLDLRNSKIRISMYV